MRCIPADCRHPFQGEDCGAIANLLHIWMAEIVALFGQKKAVAIAVKNISGRLVKAS